MQSTNSDSCYYFLKNAVSRKEVGNAMPQCSEMISGYNYSANDSVWNISHNVFPDYMPNLNSYLLDKEAKLTDFVSKNSPYFGFLVSEKAKQVLQRFHLPIHKFYPASIIKQDKNKENYFLFHYISDFSSVIDYPKSIFSVVQVLKIKENFTVNNENELLQKIESVLPYSKVVSKKISIQQGNKINYDLFLISSNDPRTYISHRLKTALEEAHITGIEIVPTDVI